MAKGRPPIPDNVHKLRGTRSKVKREAGHESPEPEAVLEIPKAPLTLQLELAQLKWNERAGQLIASKVLKVTDLDVLESYCIAFQTICECVEIIQNEGYTIPGAMGGKIANPATSIKAKAQAELRQLSTLLGLNPSARTRINVGTKEEDKPNGLGALRKSPRS